MAVKITEKPLSVRQAKQLLPGNEQFKVWGIVTKFVRKKDRNGNPYWNITLSDVSGELEGKIWSNATWRKKEAGMWDIFNPLSESAPKLLGASVGLKGIVGEYRDQLQYTFSEISYLDQKETPPHNFVRRSLLSNEDMRLKLQNLIDGTKEPVHSFLEHIFSDLAEQYENLPAAVMHHHAYVGGLMEHSLSVASSARAIAQHYLDFGVEKDINIDIVIAGALLHDLGKIDAYVLTPAPQMTIAGNVVDHIAMGYRRFMELAEQQNLPEDIALVISHIIISHHGRREYGSPLLPATREAMIIAAADNLDFQIAAWHKQIDEMDEASDVTEYIPVLERRLWRGISPVSDSTQPD